MLLNDGSALLCIIIIDIIIIILLFIIIYKAWQACKTNKKTKKQMNHSKIITEN